MKVKFLYRLVFLAVFSTRSLFGAGYNLQDFIDKVRNIHLANYLQLEFKVESQYLAQKQIFMLLFGGYCTQFFDLMSKWRKEADTEAKNKFKSDVEAALIKILGEDAEKSPEKYLEQKFSKVLLEALLILVKEGDDAAKIFLTQNFFSFLNNRQSAAYRYVEAQNKLAALSKTCDITKCSSDDVDTIIKKLNHALAEYIVFISQTEVDGFIKEAETMASSPNSVIARAGVAMKKILKGDLQVSADIDNLAIALRKIVVSG